MRPLHDRDGARTKEAKQGVVQRRRVRKAKDYHDGQISPVVSRAGRT